MPFIEDNYEALCVARTPQESGPPTLEVKDRFIAPSGLSWGEELDRDQSATISLVPEIQTDVVKDRMSDLLNNPTELWINRGSDKVFAGPILGYPTQGRTKSINARGLLYYTRYMVLEEDLSFVNVDQVDIAREIIESFQNLPYGNYGIDTSETATSGKTRVHHLVMDDGIVVYDELVKRAELIDGFNMRVDPDTRNFDLFYLGLGGQGSDLSDTVIFDRRGVADPNELVSVAAGDIASEVLGVGTNVDDGVNERISHFARNTSVRSAFGRVSTITQHDGVSVEATLEDYTQAALDSRSTQLFQPGPRLIPVQGAGAMDFGVGDVVTYSYDSGFGIMTVQPRVLSKVVTVSDANQEEIGVTFA